MLWISHAITIRQDALHRLKVGRVTSTAAKSCIALTDLASAVEIMEQGLGTTFQQMLQLKPDLNKLPPKQADDLQTLSWELYSRTAVNPMDIAIQRKDLLDDIRSQPGLEYFLLPKPYSALCHVAQEGPIVILNSHADGCDGIIILNPTAEPVLVQLPDVTLHLLKSQQLMLRELLSHCNVRTREDSRASRLFGFQERFRSKTTKECFAEMLNWLWENIVDPVYQVLASHGIHSGRLWWLPTGAFAGLPLHACPPTELFIHSYTATLGSLLEARSKNPFSVLKVGLVGVTHTTPTGGNHLSGVKQEIQKICSIVPSPNLKCLEGEDATPDAVKLQLQDCPWVHLACHGKQDLVEPTKSCLLLYDGTLDLGTILQMSISNAEFVFLAACQTAMGDAELVNESFHLGGGFVAAGFRSAVGTLWSMNDEDGPLVAEIFYSHLFRDGQRPQASDTAKALQLAVKGLKARDVPYERWIPFIHMGV
ncbi:CHAT domain-containing protein [Mycena leptocephala]|nr:CHAT domain-containing protein [Mycena leptocephala]